MAVIKLKLESLGYGPEYIEGPFDDTRATPVQGKSIQGKKSSIDQSNPPFEFSFYKTKYQLSKYIHKLIPIFLFFLPCSQRHR